MVRRNLKDKDGGHPHNTSGVGSISSLPWQTAKHALICLIGCNIGEGMSCNRLYAWLGYDFTLVLAIGFAFAIGYAV